MCLLCGWLDDWGRHSELSSDTSTFKTHLGTPPVFWHLSAHHLGKSEKLFPLPLNVSPSADNPFGGTGLVAMHILINSLETSTQGLGSGGLPSRVRDQVMTSPRVLL